MKHYFEVYEDNAGAIFMAFFNEDGDAVRIFEGFEHEPEGSLREAIQQLEADHTAFESWDGDLMERMNRERTAQVDQLLAMGRPVPLEAMEPLTARDFLPLGMKHLATIAEGDTEIGLTDLDEYRMGIAGHRAFGIRDEEED